MWNVKAVSLSKTNKEIMDRIWKLNLDNIDFSHTKQRDT